MSLYLRNVFVTYILIQKDFTCQPEMHLSVKRKLLQFPKLQISRNGLNQDDRRISDGQIKSQHSSGTSETGSHLPKGVVSLTSKEGHSPMVPISTSELKLASRFLQYLLHISKPVIAPNLFPYPKFPTAHGLPHPQATLSPYNSATPSLLSPLYTHCFLYSLATSCLQATFSPFPSLSNRNVPLSHTTEQPCHQSTQLPG